MIGPVIVDVCEVLQPSVSAASVGVARSKGEQLRFLAITWYPLTLHANHRTISSPFWRFVDLRAVSGTAIIVAAGCRKLNFLLAPTASLCGSMSSCHSNTSIASSRHVYLFASDDHLLMAAKIAVGHGATEAVPHTDWRRPL